MYSQDSATGYPLALGSDFSDDAAVSHEQCLIETILRLFCSILPTTCCRRYRNYCRIEGYSLQMLLMLAQASTSPAPAWSMCEFLGLNSPGQDFNGLVR